MPEEQNTNVTGTPINTEDLDSLDQTMDKNRYAEEDAFLSEFDDPARPSGETEEKPIQQTSVLENEPSVETTINPDGKDTTETEGDLELTIDELDESLSADDQLELDNLNKKFGTNFKDVNKFAELLKQDDNKDVVEQIEQDRNLSNYFSEILNDWTDEEIVYKDKYLIAEGDPKIDIKDPEVVEGLKAEIEDLKTNNQLNMFARTIKAEIALKNNKLKQTVEAYDNTQSQTKEQTEKQLKEELGNATAGFYNQPNFYGAKLERKNYIDAYKNVSNGNLIKQIKGDPKLAVELQLFIDSREILGKINGSATYSDGIKDTFDAIKGQSSKTVTTVGNDKKRSSGLSNFIADFIK